MQYPHVDPELLARLPPVQRGIVRALGFVRACDWLEEHGGTIIELPQYRTATYGLTMPELARVSDQLEPHLDHRRRLSIPKADRLLRRLRDDSIRAESHRYSANQQARQHRLTNRHIRNIRAEQPDDRQGYLFE